MPTCSCHRSKPSWPCNRASLTLDGAPGVVDIVVAPLFANAAVLLLLITPLITMRVLSEERRNRTLSLLFSAPVSMTEIIVGKYLGVVSFILVLIGMLR